MTTPSKCPGRSSASRPSAAPVATTLVVIGVGRVGYISSTGGVKTRSQPASSRSAESAAKVRG